MKLITNENELNTALINHWNNLPMIKHMNQTEYNKILGNPIRHHILNILTDGIALIGNNSEDAKRHALTAQELEFQITDLQQDSITIQTIYFHLEKLQKSNFIEEVAIIKKKRHYVRYFGRTAKLFLFSQDNSNEGNSPTINNIVSLLMHFSPTIDPEKMKEKLFSMKAHELAFKKAENEKIESWILKHQNILTELGIDIRKLHLFFSTNIFSEKGLKIMNEIKKMIDF